MKQEVVDIIDIWKRSYSEGVKENKAYQSRSQLRRMAALFSPGNTFFYIVNFHNLEFEYISEEVEEITGFKRDEVSMHDLLSIVIDVPSLQKKENVVQDFAINHTKENELLDYKIIYTYKAKDLKGNNKTILLQNVALTLTESGGPEHVLGMHTDITHLKTAGNSNEISIVNVNGGPSYYNLSVDEGRFDPLSANKKEPVPNLSSREKEITGLLAKGLNSERIAEKLHISNHTVNQHRKNMLRKLNCANITELVAQCLAAGVINLE